MFPQYPMYFAPNVNCTSSFFSMARFDDRHKLRGVFGPEHTQAGYDMPSAPLVTITERDTASSSHSRFPGSAAASAAFMASSVIRYASTMYGISASDLIRCTASSLEVASTMPCWGLPAAFSASYA